jgi:hypothetical protein
MENLNNILKKPFCTTKFLPDLLEAARIASNSLESSSMSLIESPEKLKMMLTCLEETIPLELELLLSKILKILFLHSFYRECLGRGGMASLIIVLRRHANARSTNASEICHTLLNSCHDPSNAQYFIDEGGMEPLLVLIMRVSDERVQVAALGLLQALCFIPGGRQLIRLQPEVCNP